MRVIRKQNDPKKSEGGISKENKKREEEISKEKRALVSTIKDLDRQIRQYERANNARDYSKDKKYVDLTGKKERFEKDLENL